jgi:hypothetical protein
MRDVVPGRGWRASLGWRGQAGFTRGGEPIGVYRFIGMVER